MARGVGSPYAHQNQLQLLLAASLGTGESIERIKQLQALAFGWCGVSLLMQSICIHPLEPRVGFPQEAGGGGWQPSPMELLRGCLGDAKAPCKGTCHALAATRDSHITQTTCTKKMLPERSHTYSALHHKPSCKILFPGCSLLKSKDKKYFQRSLLQVEPEALCS